MRYAGWVHMRGVEEGGECGEEHFDTVSGAYAHISRGGPGGMVVRMYVPGERKEVTYNEAEGVVRIGDMAEEFATGWAADMRQKGVTVEQMMAKRPEASVTRTNEGKLDRYEVSAPAEDGAACVDGRCPKSALEWVLWSDAGTGLVQRGEGTMDGKRVSIEYTYGEPTIREVYDLGVPREARVVDNRPDAATRELLERLQRRFEAGYGDYVAVATETSVGEDGREIGEGGYVYLYARSGTAFLANRYGMRDRSGGEDDAARARALRPPRPAGWPTPELGVVLEVLTGRRALGVFVGDGKQAWNGQQTEGYGSVQALVGRMEQAIPSLAAQKTLPGRVWPTREMLGAYGADTKLELVRDPGRQALAGLRSDQMAFDCGAGMKDRRRMRRSVRTFWLDPLRDDVPVEATRQEYAKGSDELEIDGRTTYTGWDRTPDGRWYPSAWRAVTRIRRRDDWSKQAADWRLQVWAGERLGVEWFADPTTKGG